MSNVSCLMNVEADRASFTWSEGPAAFEPYTLDGLVFKEFKEIADTAREKLADLIKDYLYGPENVSRAAYALAEAGYELYEALFDPGADQKRQARQVRKWLEKLAAEHQVETLEMVVESPWSLPWNVIYDQEPDEDEFLDSDESADHWRPFWGLRYNLCGGRKVDPLRRMPILKDPQVLMVVDPEIRDGLPEDQQQRLAAFADQHGLQVVHTKDELKAASKAQRPDLLYWLSHAEPDALVLSGEPVSPRNLRRLLKQDDDDDLGFGGLAFLNACQTAEGAGQEGSFFEAFHSVGFAGMIGTEHQTIDQFANPLGLDFLEAFLDRGEPVGALLRKLRGRVPLGLLYGTYCPPEIRVEKGGTEQTIEVSESAHISGVALGAALAAEETKARMLPPLPTEPYRSLAYYGRNDRALFAGRDEDTERFATMIDDAATRILVLHGESGVGKSSFLHAGAIPYLEEECLGYRFLRQCEEEGGDQAQGVLFIRATNDLCGQLAHALCEFCSQPYEYQTPLGETATVDLPGVLAEFVGKGVDQATLRSALDSQGELLGQLLSAISDRLPFSAILVIDQAEEVFTLAQSPEDLQRGQRALNMLRRTLSVSGDFKVVVSLRTEYYGRLIDRLRRGLQDTGRIREYLLTDFDEDSLLEAIRRPTADEAIPYTSDVPAEKYGFRYAEDVAEEIARRVVRYTTQRRDSVLPLVQIICAQLYALARQREDRTISLADLDTLGGIEGGMRRHVEGLLGDLLQGHPLDKKPLQRLFTQLYLKQPDGTLTTALLAEDEVRRRWTGRMPFDDLLRSAGQLRLLRVNALRIGGDEERRYVSLGHDALAKLAADWDEELSRGARLRKMVALVSAVSTVAVLMALLAIAAWLMKNEAQRNLVAKIAALEAEEAARQEALRRFSESQQTVDQSMTAVGVFLKNYPALDSARRIFLEKAAEDYERFAAEESDDPRLQLEAGRATVRLGDARRQLGDGEKAEQAYRRAVIIFVKLVDAAPDDEKPDYHLELANSHGKLALVLESAGKRADARTAHKQAMDAYDKLLDGTHDARFLVAKANSSFNRALVLNKSWEGSAGEEAEGLLRTAEDDFASLPDRRAEPEHRQALARTRHTLGQVLARRGQLDQATAKLNAAIEDWRWLVDRQKDRPNSLEYMEYLDGLAGSTNNLADVHKKQGLDAEQAYRDAVAVYEKLVNLRPTVPRYRENLAKVLTNLGFTLRHAGRTEDGAGELQKAVRHWELLVESNPTVERYELEEAATCTSFAICLRDLQYDPQAVEHLEWAIKICSDLMQDGDPRMRSRYIEQFAISSSNLGRVLSKPGEAEFELAREHFTSAIDAYSALRNASEDPFHTDGLAFSHTYLGDLLRGSGDAEGAKEHYRTALALRQELVDGNPDVPYYLFEQARLLVDCQDEDFRDAARAVELAKTARDLVVEKAGGQRPEAKYWNLLGAAYYRAGELESSIKELQHAQQLRSHPSSSDGFWLAMALWESDEKDLAGKKFDAAAAVMDENSPGNIELKRLRAEAAELLGKTQPPTAEE